MRQWSLVLLGAAALLVACGGSDGGANDVLADTAPDTIDVSPDTTPDVVPDVQPDGKPDVQPDTDPDVQPDVQPDVPPDVQPDVCQAQCGDRVCGDDGCGGSCGACEVPASCNADGACVTECAGLPSTWGPAGAVDLFVTTDSAPIVHDQCPDFSGDGIGDNALAAIAMVINPEIVAALADGVPAIAFEFVDLGEGADDSVTLNGFVGELNMGTGALVLDPTSYDPGTCAARLHMPATVDANGTLTAGPGDVPLVIPYQGLVLQVTIHQAQITGHLVSSAEGITLTDGILGGVLTKTDVEGQIAYVQTQCDGTEPPSFCEYLPMLEDLLPALLYDLDLDNDGTKDAGSACMVFTLKPATITGYVSAN